MKLSFNTAAHGAVDITSVVPPSLNKLLFLHGSPSSGEGVFGKLLFQEMSVDPFSVLHSRYRVVESFFLNSVGSGPALKMHVILKRDRTYNMQGLGDVTMREGQFNIIYVPNVKEYSSFEAGADYCSFSCFFPMVYMDEFLPFFPLINSFLQQMTNKQPSLLMLRHGWVTTVISKIIYNLLHCTLQGGIRHMYFECKLKELLIQLLYQQYDPRNERSELSGQNINSVLQAKYIIETHTGKELTVAAIADDIDVNIYKLKTIFRQFTGSNISAFMLTTRLRNARTMLRETEMPVKEIAQLAGYRSKQSFITAFKKQFDNTPGGLREEEATPFHYA